MKKMFLILGLLLAFTGQSFAATGSGNISSVAAICGIPVSNAVSNSNAAAVPLIYPTGSLTDVVTLIGNAVSSSAGNYYAFYSANSPSSGSQTKYQVPNGKTLYVLSTSLWANTSTDSALVGYGTAAIVAEPTGTAPTGEVVYAPASTSYNMYAQTTSAWTNYPIPMSFPGNSFPFWKAGVGSQQYSLMLCGLLK